MRPKLLQHGRLPPALESRLAQAYDVHPLWAETDPQDFLAERGGEFTALTTSAISGVSEALMVALPSLGVISSLGVGLDKIDLEAARKRGIAVGYTPDGLNDCVADTAFALLMDVARRISAGDRFVRKGEWPNRPFPLSTRVSGKRIGLVGMGRIGRVIARRGTGFDMSVRYHSRRPVTDVPYQYLASLVELAEWADFLVIATAGGPETEHLVNAGVLDALGQKGYLINIARGTVVDDAALIDALQSGRIAGAGLDVFANEPHVPEALFGLDNVVLLPHVASATEETRQAMGELFLENLASFFSSGRPKASALD
ncbi:2-hydroxyacid dehydrogenase [Cupriavidus sp. WKF15]|uniref:2-hydroxyacid dehydrogenase n=1 Tax=Cupriavidus sp. WKF15 TaxID=3032282 RepID=UPI0023E29E35|nr:2-hydroxyacid dehydrogenase [Cupriavidus sp. WKF15]WER46583.1 2-hydroxyacid dehydrogenase [Cupriavidus sp. WKF15]